MHRLGPLPLTAAALLAAGLLLPGAARGAQDANVRLPADSIEDLLARAPFDRPDTLIGTRFSGDRTQRVPLWFEDGTAVLVKWASAPRGGETFNNVPRYEIAAYRLQKLVLDEDAYVVPPTVLRALPLAWYRAVDPSARATFRDAASVLVVLQYWLWNVTDRNVFDPARFERDPRYAGHWANLNLLTYLIRHRDSNLGNLLVSTDSTNPRVFAVDNGVAFGSQESDRGAQWSRLRVDRFPRRTVERLLRLTEEDLHRELGVLAQFRREDGELVRAEPTGNWSRNQGIRQRDEGVQIGLTRREIADLWARIRSFRTRVQRGQLRTFELPPAPEAAAARAGAGGAPAAGDPPASGAPSPTPDRPRVEGEYGLWVEHDGEDLRVGWLLGNSAEGILEARASGREVHRTRTPRGQSHVAVFPRPETDSVVLRYGAADAPPGGLHATTVRLAEPGSPPTGVVSGVDSLFVVGDVHGEFDTLVRVLRNAGLVDGDGRWIGGASHLAVLGDLFDRGPDVTRSLWFLYRLEGEAGAAGGAVHVLLGNHEPMVLTGDLRYVSAEERLLARLHGTGYARLFDLRRSVLGRWLARRPGLLRVDGVLLAHGGVSRTYAGYGVQEFNDSLRTFMSEDLFYEWDDTTVALVTDSARVPLVEEAARKVLVMDSAAFVRRSDFFFDGESVFWFRGYVQTDTLGAMLDAVLDRHDASVHVVGHTPVDRIQARYEGRLVAAHATPAASELLLLVRAGEAPASYELWRYGTAGEPEPVEITTAGPAAPPVPPPDTVPEERPSPHGGPP